MSPPALSHRIRLRLLAFMHQRQVSQRSLLRKLTQITGETWSQSRLHKVISGRVELKVEDLGAITDALDLPLVEIVRDPGREFVSDLSPTELLVLEHIRARPDFVPSILKLMGPLEERKGLRRQVREHRALNNRNVR